MINTLSSPMTEGIKIPYTIMEFMSAIALDITVIIIEIMSAIIENYAGYFFGIIAEFIWT